MPFEDYLNEALAEADSIGREFHRQIRRNLSVWLVRWLIGFG
jgi:hypothetical protein